MDLVFRGLRDGKPDVGLDIRLPFLNMEGGRRACMLILDRRFAREGSSSFGGCLGCVTSSSTWTAETPGADISR